PLPGGALHAGPRCSLLAVVAKPRRPVVMGVSVGCLPGAARCGDRLAHILARLETSDLYCIRPCRMGGPPAATRHSSHILVGASGLSLDLLLCQQFDTPVADMVPLHSCGRRDRALSSRCSRVLMGRSAGASRGYCRYSSWEYIVGAGYHGGHG